MLALESQLAGFDSLKLGNFKDGKKVCENAISNHGIVHAVDVILPCKFPSPDPIENLWKDRCEYYLGHDLPLSRLINHDFVQAFIKTGKFFALSNGTRIDVDDCVAIYPKGRIVLSLTKDTYQELGLQGRHSTYGNKSSSGNKFVVEIDVAADCFRPGKPNHDRVMNTFRDRPELKFDMLFTWEPHDPDISSRSVHDYLERQGSRVDICVPRRSSMLFHSLPVPAFTWDPNDAAGGGSCSFREHLTWLGAVALNVDTSGSVDPFVSTFACPEPNKPTAAVEYRRWTGFITPTLVLDLFDSLRSSMNSSASSGVPWMSIVVHGFDDGPLTGTERDHGRTSASGDDLYGITLFPDSRYGLYRHATRERTK